MSKRLCQACRASPAELPSDLDGLITGKKAICRPCKKTVDQAVEDLMRRRFGPGRIARIVKRGRRLYLVK